MPRLETLQLGHCAFTVEGIASLRDEATTLRELRMFDVDEFGDEHVAATAKLDGLRGLSISGCEVSDTGISRAGESVRELSLVRCPRISSGVVRVIGDRPLERLHLVADEPLVGAELARLPQS